MKQLFNLKGKTSIVTGGASGIGKSIATLFARCGANSIIIDINDEAGRETANEIINEGHQAAYHHCDITNQKVVANLFEAIYAKNNSIDILVNNAGVAFVGSIEQTAEKDLDRLYNVNIKGTYNCSLEAIKKMKGHGGSILNLASAGSFVGIADRFAYTMTKGAIVTMTYSIAKDYVEEGIRCNCIAPGRVHTPFVDGYISENYPGKEKEMFEKLSKTQPIGRMGKPDEIAYLALFLCSDEAAFITGSNYPIDGGFVTLNS